MTLKYFQYVSKTKMELLHQQICPDKAGLSDIAPKITLAGFEIEFGIRKKEVEHGASLYKDTLEVVKALQKQNLLKSLNKHTQINTDDFYHSQGIWHQGLVRWNIRSEHRVEALKRIEAYCLFSIVGTSLNLLVGSPSHLLGYVDATKDFDQDISTSALLYVKIYRGMDQYVKLEESASNNPSLYMNSKQLEATFSLDLAGFCIQEISKLPEKSIDTVFKIYHQYNLRRNAALLSQLNAEQMKRFEESERERQRALEAGEQFIASGMVSGVSEVVEEAQRLGVFQFQYLNVGSPLYAAI